MNSTYDHHQTIPTSKTKFSHAAEILKPFGVLDDVIVWCKSEMRDQAWRWQLVQPSSDKSPGRYIFYFNDERDYCAFLLKWR